MIYQLTPQQADFIIRIEMLSHLYCWEKLFMDESQAYVEKMKSGKWEPGLPGEDAIILRPWHPDKSKIILQGRHRIYSVRQQDHSIPINIKPESLTDFKQVFEYLHSICRPIIEKL